MGFCNPWLKMKYNKLIIYFCKALYIDSTVFIETLGFYHSDTMKNKIIVEYFQNA